MYGVSEAYKTAMHEQVQRSRISGLIGDTAFTDANILAGSFSITNQCSGNDSIEIGKVYVGELKATFLNMKIDRYHWKDLVIKPIYGQLLADGTYEDVPLGHFSVYSADWTESGVVVKAYDNMAKLDEECNQIITEVTPYQCTQVITKETGVIFANSEEEFAAFANGTTMMSETTTNDVETWRDLVSWLAQAIGCFATADRNGEIVFRSYGQTVVDTIDDKHRFTGASFSDFVTRYTGISVVNMSDSTTSYYGLEVDDGLTMNLGSNPFLQYGLAETLETMRRAVLSSLQSINYVPFKVKAIGNPAYDLGDVLVFGDGIADATQLYCITKYVFKYHGDYEMTGVGQNPALSSAKSKTDKDLIGILNNTDQNKLIHYLFSNTQVSDIADGKNMTIGSIRFATATKDSEVSFWAEIQLDVTHTTRLKPSSTTITPVTVSDPPTNAELQKEAVALQDGFKEIDTRVTAAENEIAVPAPLKVKVTYLLDGSELDYHPTEIYYVDGKHVLTLHYYIGNVKANKIYTWTIQLTLEGGSCHLADDTVHAVIEGMGLAGTGNWDGTITVDEEFVGFEFASLLGKISEKVDIEQKIPTPIELTDSFSFSFAQLLGAMTEAVTASTITRYFILSDTEGHAQYSETYVKLNTEDAFILQTSYSITSASSTVDTGQLDVLDLYTAYPQLISLEGMVIS